MKIQRTEDIALLLMGELALVEGNNLLPLSHVAKVHRVSTLFLKKIARRLRQAHLIESREGVSGGYVLAKRPSEISVWEILRAVDAGTTPMSEVISAREICPLTSHCLPQIMRRTVETTLSASFKSLSLQTIVAEVPHD